MKTNQKTAGKKKISRNAPCPCGSGKKYKKCCLNKEQAPKAVPSSEGTFMTYGEVDALSTSQIADRLQEMDIPFSQEQFLLQVEEMFTAERIADHWWNQYPVQAEGRNKDFPWLAAWVLWERLAPGKNLPGERLMGLIREGAAKLQARDWRSACDIFLSAWEVLKKKCRNRSCTLDYLEKQFAGLFFVNNFIQDLGLALDNAAVRDPIYAQKRLQFYQEVLETFVHEDADMIHQLRRAVADSFGLLGDYARADEEFSRLAHDFPANPWTYIGWGDLYGFGPNATDPIRAQELYRKALELAEDPFDREAALERLEDFS